MMSIVVTTAKLGGTKKIILRCLGAHHAGSCGSPAGQHRGATNCWVAHGFSKASKVLIRARQTLVCTEQIHRPGKDPPA